MVLRANATMFFASLCVIFLVMETGVLRAATPSNATSQSVTDDKSNLDIKRSSIEKGMDVLYDMTNGFLNVVQPDKLYEQTWLNLSALAQGDFDVEGFATNWQDVSSYFLGYSICIVVGILFAVIMPIVGCCFCCCRCAGKCGGKRKLRDPKRAKCKRISYCTTLLILNTVCLAGVVCAFVTNDIIHQKLDNKDGTGPVGNIDKAVSSLQTYVNDTVEFLAKNTLDTFDAATSQIITSISDFADIAVKKVLDLVNATQFIDLTKELSTKVNVALDDLTNIQDKLNSLRNNGNNLSGNLTALKTDVEDACKIPGADCSGINLDQYKTEADYSGLRDLTQEIDNVKSSMNISQYVGEAENKIEEVKTNATKKISDKIEEAKTTMTNVKGDVSNGINEYKVKVQDATQPFFDTQKLVDDEQSDISKYGNYVWYAGLGISCLLLLIVLFYYLGVLFGMCGERPGHGAACCNTSVGGNFLMAGVAFSFIFSWLLMILCLILFLCGGVVYTEVCRYFVTHNPADLQPFENQIFKNLDFTKNFFNDSNANFSIVQSLKNCQENQAIYTALQLDSFLNIDNYLNTSLVDKEIDKIGGSTVDFNNITILTPQLRERINDFGDAGLNNIDYTSFKAQINKNLTAVDLNELAKELEDRAAAQSEQTVKNQLNGYAARLRKMDTDFVNPMEKDVESLKGSLTHLEANKDVKPETDRLIAGLESAETNFNSKGVDEVNKMLGTVASSIRDTLGNKTAEIKTMVKEEAGKCRPVYDSIYLLTDAVCVVVLYPTNGFWFSMGWCLFFFIPSIIFAVKLSTLYHREEEYVAEKGFDDPNFSMYAGPNPDTIPLTSTGPQHGQGYGAHNTGYRDDGYRGKSSNGHPAHAEGPPGYDDYFNRADHGRRNGGGGRPQRY